jgi:hypothetical protein
MIAAAVTAAAAAAATAAAIVPAACCCHFDGCSQGHDEFAPRLFGLQEWAAGTAAKDVTGPAAQSSRQLV